MSVDATLQERGSRYGTIEGNASTTQALMDVIALSPRAGELTDVHMECLHMIFHKIAPVSYTHLTLPTKRIV